MLASTPVQVSDFALDVAKGLADPIQKKLPPRYFYDELGSTLFEAITMLPEYGLSRADERLLRRYAADLADAAGEVQFVAELGSGSGKKTAVILQSLSAKNSLLLYSPIDVSEAALAICESELARICPVNPRCADWSEGLRQVSEQRTGNMPLLLLFLGSSIGNVDRSGMNDFLRGLKTNLRSRDLVLIGADLVKDTEQMLLAYDDPTGVTAAFNLNLLGRMNRELQARFNLRSFAHEVRWDMHSRRIEMHLLSCREQTVSVAALETSFHFDAGETIWTESSHKFTVSELDEFALSNGFMPISTWIDEEWPFAEVLWQVR